MDGPLYSREHKVATGLGRTSVKGDRQHETSDERLSFNRVSTRSFRRGEVIAMAGILMDTFARVKRGVVSGSTTLPDGREFIVELIPRYGFIGELEVLRRQTLSLEYRAASDCELHFFDGRSLREKYANDPDFQEELLSKALARVSELELRMIANAGMSLQSRLANALLRLSKVYPQDTPSGHDELIISQQDLAATLPASREKVNQCLRRLRENNIIGGTQGRIRILNRKALQEYADNALT